MAEAALGLAQALALSKLGMEHRSLADLTVREFEILRMATDGMGTPAIARALHLSDKTVYNTMSLVRNKLGVHSDFALMRLVTEHGLNTD